MQNFDPTQIKLTDEVLQSPPYEKQIHLIEDIDNKRKIDAFCFFRENSSHLIVLLPSAQNKKNKLNPVFHRWSWAYCFNNESVIAISDPSLYFSSEISSGWFISGDEKDLIVEIADFVKKISKALGIDESKIILYGSSMGGFGALMLASCLEGAFAIAEVPQIDLRRYGVKSALKDISNELLNGEDIGEYYQRFPERVSIIDRFLFQKRVPSFDIVTNSLDDAYLEQQEFYKKVSQIKNGISKKGDINFTVLSHDIGHKPLQTLQGVALIKSVINRGWSSAELSVEKNNNLSINKGSIDFDISFTICENIAKARVIVGGVKNHEMQYYFYIYRYGALIGRQEWSKSEEFEFSLHESGSYSIQAHVRYEKINIYKKTAPIFFAKEQDLDLYKNFIKKSFDSFQSIEPYLKNHPYQDIVVLIKKDGFDSKLKNDLFESNRDFYHKEYVFSGMQVHVFSQEELSNYKDGEFFFSGVAKSLSGDLIIGQNELNNPFELKDSIGNFALVKIDSEKEEILFENDYFGNLKYFYYRNSDFFVVSTSYHRLILLLRDIGIALKVNIQKVLANFAFCNLQPFHQQFTHEMDLDGVSLLPVDRSIVFSNYGLKFYRKDIGRVLEYNGLEDDLNYDVHVKNAANEIVENCRVALKRNDIDNFIVDLSGGFDSRAVFSAITNTHHKKEKIYINSKKSSASPLEHIVAININGFYGYKYDDLTEFALAPNSSVAWNDCWSYNLGVYYSYKATSFKFKISKTIRITGAYGDYLTRPIYTKNIINTDLDTEDMSNFIKRYFEKYQHMSYIASVESIESAKWYFENQLKDLPGTTPLQKFENLYLFFRNGLHFSDQLKSDYSCLEWAPLQSKELLRMKVKYFNNQKDSRQIFDLIYCLNPLISKVPYEADENNREKNILSMSDKLISEDVFYQNIDFKVSDDESLWKEANRRKNIVRENIVGKEVPSEEEYWKLVESSLAFVLRKIPLLEKSIGFQLWHIISTGNDTPSLKSSIHSYANRITSLGYQMKIIE